MMQQKLSLKQKGAQGHTKKTGEETWGEECVEHLFWVEKFQAEFSNTVNKIAVTTH